MIRTKTFDSTGIATGGRVYAADLNAIQDAAAGVTDLTQNVSVASLIVGEVGLTISRFGTGEMQVAGGFRSSGILRGTGGLYAGQFTTTSRNAIAAGGAPNGIIIFNTTTGQFEWNSGSDGARVWKSLGIDTAGSLALSGGSSALTFTDQTAANYPFSAKRTADTVPRIAIKEDGTIEFGAGGASARDANLYRSAADVLKSDDSIIIAGAKGVMQTGNYGTAFPGTPSDGQMFILVDSITFPTYQWQFRYNAGSSNADKWEAIGPVAAFIAVETSENGAATTPGDLTTVGPSFTVPRAGVYRIEWGCLASQGHSGGFGSMSMAMGATAASLSIDARSANSASSVMRKYEKTGLSASDLIRAKYACDNASFPATFAERWMTVAPVRLS